jgi:sigma-B regulation protein RsbU (phosphoserine phosphatase)
MAAAKILIADDEPDIELLIRQRFRREIRDGKYAFAFSRNGREALERLREDPGIEVVLSDINMPEMDGLTLLGRIRELANPVLKAVIVSAYGDMENIRTAMNRGAFDFLTKPIDLEDLARTIDKTLEQLATLKAALQARDELVSVQRELSLAHRIQQSMLPRQLPARPDVELLATMLPAREIGGDFYDFFALDDRRIALAVGDVSGKGVAAAIYMALARTLLRAIARSGAAPDLCLAEMNRVLCDEVPSSNLFVTVFYGVLDTASGELRYCNGGHPGPYVLRAGEPPREIEDGANPIVGILPKATYGARSEELAPGDTLCVFSDGIPEATDAAGRLFGEERFAALLGGEARAPLQDLVTRVVDELHAWAGDAPASDDLTLLFARYRGDGAR